MALYVVTGAPTAGKTTYVQQHAKPGDIRIDFDHIANLLTDMPVDNHLHAAAVRRVARGARREAIRLAIEAAQDTDVWIIHTKPNKQQMGVYLKHNAQVITLDPGLAVVRERVRRERPAEFLQVVEDWYQPERRTTTQQGYGWQHQKVRRKLLALHTDGSPCWWCGKPMYRDKRRNHDGLALAADHTEAGGAKNGQDASRLLHGSCNSQAKDHVDDNKRPAAVHTKKRGKGSLAGFSWK